MNNPTSVRNPLVGDWLDLHCALPGREEVVLPVLSGSMAPLLCPGGRARVRRSSWRQCRPGDVVVFREAARLVAHRCLWRVPAGGRCWLFQKGDRDTFGSLIDGRRIVGVVIEAWDRDGTQRYVRSRVPVPRRELRRQMVRDLAARLMLMPRVVKRLGRRAAGA